MPNTIITDTETIHQIVAEASEASVKKHLPPLIRAAVRKSYLTGDEVMDLTGWSRRTLQHLRDTRQLPFVQHGRKIVYPTVGVEEFLREHEVPARGAARGRGGNR